MLAAGQELHGVVDRQTGRDRAAGRVDVERDVLGGVLGLEIEQLGDDQAADLVVDGAAKKDDAVLQQTRVDVVGALATTGLLDNHGNQHGHEG
jgi:hypothetical protein